MAIRDYTWPISHDLGVCQQQREERKYCFARTREVKTIESLDRHDLFIQIIHKYSGFDVIKQFGDPTNESSQKLTLMWIKT